MALCKKCRSKVKDLWSKVDVYLLNNIDIALSITTNIVKFLESPIADFIVNIIPGELDNKVKSAALGFLKTVLVEMKLVKASDSPVDQLLKDFFEYLKNLPKEQREAMLIKIGSLLTREIDGNRFKDSFYDAIVQNCYTLNK